MLSCIFVASLFPFLGGKTVNCLEWLARISKSIFCHDLVMKDSSMNLYYINCTVRLVLEFSNQILKKNPTSESESRLRSVSFCPRALGTKICSRYLSTLPKVVLDNRCAKIRRVLTCKSRPPGKEHLFFHSSITQKLLSSINIIHHSSLSLSFSVKLC